MLKSRFLAFVIFLFIGSLTCNKAKVTASDLTGTWVVADASRKHLSTGLQKASAKIILNADGNFFASELPGEVLYIMPEDRTRLVTGSGVWQLGLHQGEQVVQLKFRVIADANKDFVTQLYVSNAGSIPILFYFHGDPDEGVRIKLEKK